MTRRRFLADEVHGDRAVLTGQNAAHLARVLRARVGQEYEIAGEGIVRVGTIVSVRDDRVEFELGAEVGTPVVDRPFPKEGKDRPPIQGRDWSPIHSTGIAITLVLAVFKFDRFEWAVEKATELGVATIVPVIARRTDAHLAQAAVKRLERWRRIAHEASQQSRRTEPPEIGDPVKLKAVLGIEAGLKILLAEAEEERSLKDVLTPPGTGEWSGMGAQPGMAVLHNSVAMAVGPEGGWAADELKMFESAGWIAASLGSTILRAETAVVAGLAVVNALSSSN